MVKSADNQEWVYVIIRDPNVDDKLAAIHDKEKDIYFIPVFRKREEADNCLLNLPLERGIKYEVQAIFREDLYKDAAQNGFLLFFLSEDGRINERIDPKSIQV